MIQRNWKWKDIIKHKYIILKRICFKLILYFFRISYYSKFDGLKYFGVIPYQISQNGWTDFLLKFFILTLNFGLFRSSGQYLKKIWHLNRKKHLKNFWTQYSTLQSVRILESFHFFVIISSQTLSVSEMVSIKNH